MESFKITFVFVLVFIASVKSTSELTITSPDQFSGFTACENDEDCDHLVGAKCDVYMCVCNGTRICEDAIKIIVTKIGENCTIDDDCNIDNAECGADKKCICKDEYVKSTNAKRCLIVSEGLGGFCEDSVQCHTKTPYSVCQSHKCVCQEHMHEHNGSCFRNVELGQNCENNEECSITKFSECVNSKCACREQYVARPSGSKCLPIAKGLRSPCGYDAQCTPTLGGGSECIDRLCDCKEMYQFKNGTNKCVRDMLLGDVCENHSDCHDPYRGPRRLECIVGVCKCKPFYIEEEGYCISSSQNVTYSIVIIVYNVLFLNLYTF